jgi:hypothetical protein
MKQNINVEQMKEVKDTVLAEALNDLEFKEGLGTLNILLPEDYRERDIWLHNMASRVTIGKMIEIINNKKYYFCIEEVGITIFDEGQDEYVSFNNGELADALWEAIKYVLEEENNES